jgi:hypothetical protein
MKEGGEEAEKKNPAQTRVSKKKTLTLKENARTTKAGDAPQQGSELAAGNVDGESASIYAGALNFRELGDYERFREANPDEEIVMLRMVIRRMLYLLNEAKAFQEIIQTLNALGYITGRLSKLFEVKMRQARVEKDQPGELERMLEMTIQEMVELWEKEGENGGEMGEGNMSRRID